MTHYALDTRSVSLSWAFRESLFPNVGVNNDPVRRGEQSITRIRAEQIADSENGPT